MKNEKTVLQEINQFMKELVDVKSARENYEKLADLSYDTGMTIKIFSVTDGGGVNRTFVRFSKGKMIFTICTRQKNTLN